MDCRTFQKKLEDYREGRLDFPNRFSMERHAQQCFLCDKDLGDAESLGRASQALRRVGAPPDFETAFRARLSRESGRNLRVARLRMFNLEWHSPSMLTAGFLSLVVLVFGTLVSIHRFLPVASSSPPSSVTVRPDSVPPIPIQPSPNSSPNPTGISADAGLRVSTEVSHQQRLTGKYSEEPVWAPIQTDQPESEFKEYVVPGPGNRQFIMRLPKTIRMQYGQPSEEYFIRNVSH